jgi:hypothetical protein
MAAIDTSFIVTVVYKSIAIATHITLDYRHFLEDKLDFHYRLNHQISRLEEVQGYLSDSRIADNVKPRDWYSYVHIIRKIHDLLLHYILTTSPNDVAKQIAAENAADDVFRQMEMNDPTLRDPTPTQEMSWLRIKKMKLSWAFYLKREAEKLVVKVEWWGDQLDKLSSATIPPIQTRLKISSADIIQISPSESQSETAAKGQLLIATREDPNSVTVGGSLVWAHKETYLDFSRLRFLNPAPTRTAERDERDDLGGRVPRQWAQLLDENGIVKEARVVVEFKERPPPELVSERDVEQARKQLRSLVAILRMAAKHSQTFHVLHCHGFYETKDRYGLVYQLPPLITNDAMQCETLTNILGTPAYSQLLGDNIQNRCDLAKSLALTMFHFHSVQWLHKSFNPDNILLFVRKSDDGPVFDWTRPYMVGFDASRNIRDESQKRSVRLLWDERVYIHPDRQRDEYSRFQKLYDIYALGVVLLEIGRLSCFKDLSYKLSGWPRLSSNQLRQRLIDTAKELRKIMGITFEEIVTTCLQGTFGVVDDDADETQLSDAFRIEVCEKFETIHY